eukprot:EG_transcript_9847
MSSAKAPPGPRPRPTAPPGPRKGVERTTDPSPVPDATVGTPPPASHVRPPRLTRASSAVPSSQLARQAPPHASGDGTGPAPAVAPPQRREDFPLRNPPVGKPTPAVAPKRPAVRARSASSPRPVELAVAMGPSRVPEPTSDPAASSSSSGSSASASAARAKPKARRPGPAQRPAPQNQQQQQRDDLQAAILQRVLLLRELEEQQRRRQQLLELVHGDPEEEDEDVQLAIALSLSAQQAAGREGEGRPHLPIAGRGSHVGATAADGGSAEEDDLLTALERQQLRAALLQLRRQRLLAALGLPLGLAGDGDGGAAELPDMSYEALLQLEDVKVGVGEEFLEAMPVILFEATKEVTPECSICLGQYEPGEALTLLQCTHRFHLDCCQTWLRDHKTCPVCKLDVTEVAMPAPS